MENLIIYDSMEKHAPTQQELNLFIKFMRIKVLKNNMGEVKI